MSSRNATNHVPLTAAFRQRLAIDRTTPAAGVVYAIASDPSIVGAEPGGTLEGLYWWDPLAAVAAAVRGVDRFEPLRSSIGQSGADAPWSTARHPRALRRHGIRGPLR
jgi:hypothetical protein